MDAPVAHPLPARTLLPEKSGVSCSDRSSLEQKSEQPASTDRRGPQHGSAWRYLTEEEKHSAGGGARGAQYGCRTCAAPQTGRVAAPGTRVCPAAQPSPPCRARNGGGLLLISSSDG